eukprot:9595412-Alexandrium_andersonii.AAC.1
MQPKAAESCRAQLSAASGGFVQLCAPFGALSRWLRAPQGAHSCTKKERLKLQTAAFCSFARL